MKGKASTGDYGLGRYTYPRGWFVVAEASDLGDEPTGIDFFGQSYVMYRGRSGRVVILDAHCAHMKTHMGRGTSAFIHAAGQNIEGDSIRCPYHGWKYGADGSLEEIPYEPGPCPRALSIGAYPAVEAYGCIFMWHCPEGGAPDFGLPKLAVWDQPDAIHWQLDHLGQLAIHPVEIIDNMADVHHLGPTHGAPCEYFENEFRGPQVIQRQGGFLDYYKAHLHTVTWYTGPELLISKQSFNGIVRYEFIANTPVSDGVVQLWHGVLSFADKTPIDDAAIALARQAQAEALETFSADFEIWKHKEPATTVMQTKHDGRFRELRRWVSQFYMPRDEVSELHHALDGVLPVPGFAQPPTVEGFEADCFELRSVSGNRG